jgi:sugar phosphate isomerase/epimerase
VRKFALSSSAYSRFKFAQAVRHIALAGYAGVELVADAPHGYPPVLNEADRKGMHSALAQSRLAVSNVNAGPMTALRDDLRPSWIEPDVVLRQERLQHTLDAAQLAKDIGGPSISTLGGGPPDPDVPPDRARTYFLEGLQQVAADAATKKLPILFIEPRPGLLIETAEQALEVVAQVGAKRLGVTVNTGHFHRGDRDLAAAVRRLGPALGHVHVEDVAPDGSGTVVVPGTGLVDFATLFAALGDIGYDGWLTVEQSGADMHPDDAARQALTFLRQFDE